MDFDKPCRNTTYVFCVFVLAISVSLAMPVGASLRSISFFKGTRLKWVKDTGSSQVEPMAALGSAKFIIVTEYGVNILRVAKRFTPRDHWCLQVTAHDRVEKDGSWQVTFKELVILHLLESVDA